MRQEIDSDTLQFLEREYEDYLRLDMNIATRKVLLDRNNVVDENIGGGQSNLPGDPTGERVVKYAMDNYIIKQEDRRNEVDRAMVKMVAEQIKIIEMKFWSDNYYTWDEMADLFFVSSRTMYKKRYKILELLAKSKGIIQ